VPNVVITALYVNESPAGKILIDRLEDRISRAFEDVKIYGQEVIDIGIPAMHIKTLPPMNAFSAGDVYQIKFHPKQIYWYTYIRGDGEWAQTKNQDVNVTDALVRELLDQGLARKCRVVPV